VLDLLETKKPLLVFAYGNPSRGDDALGPELLQQLEIKIQHSELQQLVELQTDFQLQIEHTLDMKDRQKIVFIDASIKPETAFTFSPLQGVKDTSYSSHAMSPESLLNLFEQLYPDNKTNVFLLEIRGYQFDLGNPITHQAENNLQQGLNYLYNWLSKHAALDYILDGSM